MRFILRRAGFFLLTLWAAVTLNFFLPRLMPGNPAIAMMAKFHGRVTGQGLAALENIFGVDTHTSLPVQYVHYLGQIATGNFGTSLYFYPSSVSRVVLEGRERRSTAPFTDVSTWTRSRERSRISEGNPGSSEWIRRSC